MNKSKSFFGKHQFAIFLILIIFVLMFSFFIRYDNIVVRPLATHNEDASAHVLITLLALEENNITVDKFLPIFTLNKPYDKGINDFGNASIEDSAGNYFYTSFPPFGFIAPYLYFKLSNLPISIVNLRIFNFLIGGITAILLFGFLIKFLRYARPQNNNVIFISFLGSVIYIFSSESLWSHANAYWGQCLVQPLWVILLIVIVDIIEKPRISNLKLALLTVSVFLLCYTEWSGYIIALSVIIIGIYYLKTGEGIRFKYLIVIPLFAAIGSFLIMLLQFSSISGVGQYLLHLSVRAGVRYGNITQILELMKNYLLGFGPFIIVLIILLIGVFIFKSRLTIIETNKQIFFTGIMFLSWFPLIENFIFLNHSTAYTYDILKLAIPLIITTCYTIIILYEICKNQQGILSLAISLIMILAISISVGIYFDINNPYLIKDIRFTNYEQVGSAIKNNTAEDEIAFTNLPVRAHLIFYAQRNIVEKTNTINDVKTFLANSSIKKGKLFFVGGGNYNLNNYDVFYPWIFYGEISGVVTYDLNQDRITSLIITPAHFSDNNWHNGFSNNGPGFFVHDSSIFKYLSVNNTLQNQKNQTFTIKKIVNDQLWFNDNTNITDMENSQYFRIEQFE